MKTIHILFAATTIIAIHTGCAARATGGNHGVAVSAKAHGSNPGASVRVY